MLAKVFYIFSLLTALIAVRFLWMMFFGDKPYRSDAWLYAIEFSWALSSTLILAFMGFVSESLDKIVKALTALADASEAVDLPIIATDALDVPAKPNRDAKPLPDGVTYRRGIYYVGKKRFSYLSDAERYLTQSSQKDE